MVREEYRPSRKSAWKARVSITLRMMPKCRPGCVWIAEIEAAIAS
ncbi:MAG: hypothetical protein AB1768_06955 [Pseudomonadota bacterium]|jgi:hypothetical protein